MINNKAKKIAELERKLMDVCTAENLKMIAGFTVIFSSDDGRTISYVKDMPIDGTGIPKDFYDETSNSFSREIKDIDWPYTGFVKGNVLGWRPISHQGIIDLLEKHTYDIEDFTDADEHFLHKYI